MATRSAAATLSTEDLEWIRQVLASGRRPRVVFTEAAGQIVGQIGQVVELTDPALSDEWLVVRFGHDELPFSPTDLALPSRTDRGGARGRRGGRTTAAGEPAPPPTTAAPAPTGAAAPSTTKEHTVASVDPSPTAPPAQPSRTRAASTSDPAPTTRAGGRQGGRASRGKAAPAMTVTLTYQEGAWSVTVHQGSRTLVKAVPVPAARILPALTGLEVPEVDEAVEKLVAAERAEVEQRAEQLRTELAQVEAKLAELSQIPLA